MGTYNWLFGLVVGAVVGAGGMYGWIERHAAQRTRTDTSIVFPDKVFSDTGEVVTIKGRWAGEGIGYKNNVMAVTCVKTEHECWVSDLNQIGVDQVSLDLYALPLTGWTDSLVTASDGDVSCARNTLNIQRRGQNAEWVAEPVNQSKVYCEHFDTKTYKWHLEGSLFWDGVRAVTAAGKQ